VSVFISAPYILADDVNRIPHLEWAQH
jgi:hypothetical protein